MEAVSRQLKKGVLDILLLKLLERKEMYGYELMTALEKESCGFFATREGTLYPVLYRLEDAGHIQSSWSSEGARRGVPRKYYAITREGIRHLRQAEEELALFIKGIEAIMGRKD